MQIAGPSYPVTAFRPITIPAIKWMQGSDGYWRGRDLGAAFDKYRSEILFRGKKSEIYGAWQTFRTSGWASINGENDEEYTMFGAERMFFNDVDYIYGTVIKLSELQREPNQDLMSFKVLLQADPQYMDVLYARTLPVMYPQSGSTEDLSQSLRTHTSLDSANIWINTHGIDTGTYETEIKFMSWEQAGQFRRFLLEENGGGTEGRAKAFTIDANTLKMPGGFAPFGETGQTSYLVKCIEWEDLGASSLTSWDFKIKLVQHGN